MHLCGFFPGTETMLLGSIPDSRLGVCDAMRVMNESFSHVV